MSACTSPRGRFYETVREAVSQKRNTVRDVGVGVEAWYVTVGTRETPCCGTVNGPGIGLIHEWNCTSLTPLNVASLYRD